MSRLSNFELLRILAMIGVLMCHILQLYNIQNVSLSADQIFCVFLMNVGIIAVNCFVLISGYFRIKISWKGFYNLYTQLTFYALLLGFLSWLVDHESFMNVLKSFFSMSESNLWFVRTYIGLFLISPLLNKALDSVPKKQLLRNSILLVVLDVYFGYIHQINEISIDGYNLLHFICIYYWGGCLSQFDFKQTRMLKNLNWGLIWALLVCVMVCMYTIKMRFFPISIVYSLRYNSPMVLLASLVFFMWVQTWTIKAKWINQISILVFSVYLIHQNPFVWKRFVSVIEYIQYNFYGLREVVVVFLFMLLFFLFCIFIDKLRLILIKPIANCLTQRTEIFFEK